MDNVEAITISHELVGQTYTAEELLKKLYIENLHLKAQLESAYRPSPLAPAKASDVEIKSEYDLVRAYRRSASDGLKKTTRHLVIANDYPRRGNEYGNGFIHRRVKMYQEYGNHVDVIAFGKRRSRTVYEYDGVRVLSGYVHELSGLLATEKYDSVSIHFLNSEMWNVASPYLHSGSTYVFVHGYEARSWIRQSFEHQTSQQLENAIERSFFLQGFWRGVLADKTTRVKFFFVSDFWARAVTEDLECTFPQARTQIIHNFIDTELFQYVEKEPKHRFKILWARSASALNYGHDIAIQVLKILKRSQYWNDVEVRIIGDGKHFSEFDDAFCEDENVSVEQGFVSQVEIAKLHKEHGIFLVPTRLDSQGVSRDEAMSSGLVPVTNAVAAIPEFVNEECGILAPPECAKEMADGIIGLFENPDRFLQMSRAAALRVRGQSSEKYTVQREAEAMGLQAGRSPR